MLFEVDKKTHFFSNEIISENCQFRSIKFCGFSQEYFYFDSFFLYKWCNKASFRLQRAHFINIFRWIYKTTSTLQFYYILNVKLLLANLHVNVRHGSLVDISGPYLWSLTGICLWIKFSTMVGRINLLHPEWWSGKCCMEALG